MSYRRALGVIPAVPVSGALPSFEEATFNIEEKDGHQWGKIGSHSVLAAILARLKAYKAIAPEQNTIEREGDGRMLEEAPFLRALRAFWVRQGRVEALWPAVGRSMDHRYWDFGPNTDSSRAIRINKTLYNLLKTAPFYTRNEDTYVRLQPDDYLYSDIIKNKLIRDGYLPANAPTSTQDDSLMVQALRAYWDEMATAGLERGAWPGGFNFGPHTNNEDTIRVAPQLIDSLVSRDSPRSLARAKAIAEAATEVAKVLAGRVRPPKIGTLSGTGGGSPAVRAAIQRAAASTLLQGGSMITILPQGGSGGST